MRDYRLFHANYPNGKYVVMAIEDDDELADEGPEASFLPGWTGEIEERGAITVDGPDDDMLDSYFQVSGSSSI